MGSFMRTLTRKVHMPCCAEDVAAQLELEDLLRRGGRAHLAAKPKPETLSHKP